MKPLAILPLDTQEFLFVIQHYGAEKAAAYVCLQIHYLQHGPLPNQADVIAAASAPPRIDASDALRTDANPCMDSFRIDANDGKVHHPRLDKYRAKFQKTKERMTALIRKRWGEPKAKNANTTRIDAQCTNTPRIYAKVSLDKGAEEAKAQRIKEVRRKAANSRWARYKSELRAKNANTLRIAGLHEVGIVSITSLGSTTTNDNQLVLIPLAGSVVHPMQTPDTLRINAKLGVLARSGAGEDVTAHHKVAGRMAAARTRGNGHRKSKRDLPDPPGKSDERYEICRDAMFKCWEEAHPGGLPCPWTEDDTRALGKLLVDNPTLTTLMFDLALSNWVESEDVNRSTLPKELLPKLLQYSGHP